MNMLKTKWVAIVFLISTFAIASALIAEYSFGILPCEMCLYQRQPYYFMIAISFIFLLTQKIPIRFYYWLAEASFIYGFYYSIWHVGIEKKLIAGPSGCNSTLQLSDSLTSLKNQIINQAIIPCDEITWSIIGISAASINSLLLFILLIFNTILLIQNLYINEKKN